LLEDDCTLSMKVASLTVDPFTSLPVVILRDDLDQTAVPISVGLSEASAIAAELDGIELERPMTHHLMSEMLDKAGVVVEYIVVRDVEENTFFATVHLLLPCGTEVVQDARPSDALALALRCKADIRVASRVIRKLLRLESPGPWQVAHAPPGVDYSVDYSVDEGADLLEGLGDEAFGKWKN
jgi:bifunctional DNase/RNase